MQDKKAFDYKTSRLLYMTTILPVIDYCCTVYCVANATELDRLQRLQNVALCMISKQGLYCPIYELHHRTQIDTLAT